MEKRNAVVIFSGGQDSTTCLLKAMSDYNVVHCLTFDYGQRHALEIEVARNITKRLGIKFHKIIHAGILNEPAISSLTRTDIAVPNHVKFAKNGR